MTKQQFKPDLSKFPHRAGCYLMFDKSGKVIYVGKAIDLNKRIKSYWNKNNQTIPPGQSALSPSQAPPQRGLCPGGRLIRVGDWARGKTSKLLEKVAKLDFMITDTEAEALILENQLIKKHLPLYNVLLRDDKSYQYIKIDLNQPYPVIEAIRNTHAIKKETRVRYFGPYTSGLTVKYTLQLINRIFPLCANAGVLNKSHLTPSSPNHSSGRRGGELKPCLNWHLGKCLGVCADKSSSAEYHQVVREVIDFLSGKSKDWRKYLRQRMEAASLAKKFEEALKLREQIAALDTIVQKQKVAQPDELISQDIWGWLITAEQAVVTISKIRQGKVIDYQTFVLKLPMEIKVEEFVSEALMSIYSATFGTWPKEILLPHLPKDRAALEGWLSDLAGHTIKITLPQRGIKKQLSLLVQKNAVEQASAKVGINLQIKTAISRLQKLLRVKQLKRIEAYDISHLGGTATVGSMVVFAHGKPIKTQYRRFRIKTVRGIDDYASLGEIIYRRLKPNRLVDKRFAENLPDLILIDGGKGQLNSVLKKIYKISPSGSGDLPGRRPLRPERTPVPTSPILLRTKLRKDSELRRAGGMTNMKIISLAKREEEIFVSDQMNSIKLSLSSPELQLLQRIRDEAHRFAITYQAVLHARQTHLAKKIPGIGAATQKKLVAAFGSLKAAQAASLPDLEKVIGKKAPVFKPSAEK